MSDENKTVVNSQYINIKVLGQDNAIFEMKIKRHTSLINILEKYCEQAKLKFDELKFRFDAKVIDKKDTSTSMEMEDGDTIEVYFQQKKKTSKKRARKPRREAILIKPAEGRTYADVLAEIRSKASPADSGTEVRRVRQTRQGEVLVELCAKTGDKAAFNDVLRKFLGDKATLRSLEPKVTLEIRDLDALTTPEEVEGATKRDLAQDLSITITKANGRGQKIALVKLNIQGANSCYSLAILRWNG